MTETCATDIAYIAGFIDADGWIGLHPHNAKTPWQNYFWMIGIVNRDLLTLQWVQSLFGGKVKPRSRNRKAEFAKKWSPVFDWVLYDSQEAKRFLSAVLPYLRVKKRQAELVLSFVDTIQNRNLQYRLPEEVKQRRLAMFKECKALNSPHPVDVAEGVN